MQLLLKNVSSVCEEVAHDGSIFDDGQILMDDVHDAESAKSYVTKIENLDKVEERIIQWIQRLKDFMLESKQVRRETDSSGPQQELEYWKRRGAQFSQLVSRLEVFRKFRIIINRLVILKLENWSKKFLGLRGQNDVAVLASFEI